MTCMKKVCVVLITFSLLAIEVVGGGADYTQQQEGDHWTEEYCQSGSYQSPIGIHSNWFDTCTEWVGEEKFDADATHLKVTDANKIDLYDYSNRDGALKVKSDDDGVTGGKFTLDDVEYTFDSLHYHHRAEHSVDGQYHDFEFHQIHANSDANEYVVLTVFGDCDENKAAPVSTIDNTPDTTSDSFSLLFGAKAASSAGVAAIDLSTDTEYTKIVEGDFFIYRGSLTTPPCTEVVTFVIFSTAYKVHCPASDTAQDTHAEGTLTREIYDWQESPDSSVVTLEQWADVFGTTGRSTQDRNGRSVYKNRFTIPAHPSEDGFYDFCNTEYSSAVSAISVGFFSFVLSTLSVLSSM